MAARRGVRGVETSADAATERSTTIRSTEHRSPPELTAASTWGADGRRLSDIDVINVKKNVKKRQKAFLSPKIKKNVCKSDKTLPPFACV